jgi:hypothetical protein
LQEVCKGFWDALTGLKALELTAVKVATYPELPPLPRLERLMPYSASYKNTSAINFGALLKMLVHPQLTHLTLDYFLSERLSLCKMSAGFHHDSDSD